VDPSLEILVPINALVMTGLANLGVGGSETIQERVCGKPQRIIVGIPRIIAGSAVSQGGKDGSLLLNSC
jgi:hypothetical protein